MTFFMIESEKKKGDGGVDWSEDPLSEKGSIREKKNYGRGWLMPPQTPMSQRKQCGWKKLKEEECLGKKNKHIQRQEKNKNKIESFF